MRLTASVIPLIVAVGVTSTCGLYSPSEAGDKASNVLATPMALEQVDRGLQTELEVALAELDLQPLVRRQQIGVALVDLTVPEELRYAGVNDDVMFYAASLPKIAILLTVFEKIEAGELDDSKALRQTLTDMIRVSSNSAATRAIRLVGFDSIAETLEKPEYRLYDLTGSGGLWVGKAYDPTPAVRRDPLFNYSHGATARQAARFFALLERGLLVSRERSREMLEILGDPGIKHKFVRGLSARPGATIYRKSGSFRQHHADAALIEHNGHRYIAAALVDDPRGGRILEKLILALDDIIVSGGAQETATARR
jgi:beta-lactamase class A